MPPNNSMPQQQGQPAPNYVSASEQKKHHSMLIIPFVLTVFLLIGAVGFGAWAFMERQDYKNNVDEKIAAAVEVSNQEVASAKDAEYLEREKEPFVQYRGPSTFGSVDITYPRTWSAYVDDIGKGTVPVNGYFHPKYVPSEDAGVQFALRIEVVNRAYSQEMRKFDSVVKSGKASVSPYRAPNVGDVLGSRIEGEIASRQNGYMVVFPLRDKTLKIWTESESFLKDFNQTILPNLVFVP
jgi:hypothetical protein